MPIPFADRRAPRHPRGARGLDRSLLAGTAIENLERRNWDVIPAPHRTSPPKELQHVDLTLKRGSDRAILQIIRRPEGWLVTAVQRPR